MPLADNPARLPFNEAIEFFRDKVRLPTRTWTDIREGMHARAFVVAGAMKDELLTDFQRAIDKGLKQGTSYKDFQRDFDRIVQQHGWQYNGGRGWRSRVIWRTNMRTAYQAGRYQQMMAIRERRPYWMYHHSDFVADPRPHHVALDGLILRWDDPFWRTHYPPNGWGCQCKVFTRSARDMERLGLKVGTSPTLNWEDKVIGSRGPNPRTIKVPEGIDPGWAYNVGEAAWGKPLSEEAMDAWRKHGASAWQRLTPGDWRDSGRPEKVPVESSIHTLATKARDRQAVQDRLRDVLDGDEKVFHVGGTPYRVNVNAEVLGEHIDPVRAQYLPFLEDLLNDPYEVWLAFEQHKGTGLVALRMRYIKMIETGKKQGVLMVAQANRGQLEAWTFVPSRPGYINKQRVGKLLMGK